MKITCRVGDLLRGLEEVSSVAGVSVLTGSKVLLSVQDSILLAAHEGYNTLFILTKVDGQISSSGKCLIAYEELKRLLKNNDSENLVILELLDGVLKVKFIGKNGKFQLGIEDADYFPHIGLKQAVPQFQVDLDLLKEALNRLRLKFQTNDQGIRCVRKDLMLSLQTFDGVALLHEIKIPIQVFEEFPNFMLDVSTPSYIKSLLDQSCSFSINEKGLVTVKTQRTVLIFPTLTVPEKIDAFGLMERQYLAKSPLRIPVDLTEFFRQIKIIADFTDTEEIRVSVKDSIMAIKAQNADKGLIAELEMDADCPDLIFGINPKLLGRPVKLLSEATLFYIPNKAILVRSEKENMILAIMRIIHDY